MSSLTTACIQVSCEVRYPFSQFSIACLDPHSQFYIVNEVGWSRCFGFSLFFDDSTGYWISGLLPVFSKSSLNFSEVHCQLGLRIFGLLANMCCCRYALSVALRTSIDNCKLISSLFFWHCSRDWMKTDLPVTCWHRLCKAKVISFSDFLK